VKNFVRDDLSPAQLRGQARAGDIMAGKQRIAARLIPAEEWSPLDGTPAPEYIPPDWMGFHVGTRLIEALRVLQRMPAPSGPRVFGNGWPEMLIEFADQAQYADDPEWQLEQTAELHHRWRKTKPTSIAIARMEQAIAWPARYLRDLPQLITVVQAATAARARYRSLRWVERQLRLPGRLVRRWHREGLDLIADGLRRDHVPVF
jgi:hypothetical protein